MREEVLLELNKTMVMKMKVNGISNTNIFPNEQVNKKPNTQKSGFEIKDKVEISKAAQEKFQAESKSKIEKIRENIANKVYDSDEVINQVVEKILNEIKED